MPRGYQYGYSEKFAEHMYDVSSRRSKALRAVQMIRENSSKDISEQKCIEIGSSTGILSFYLSFFFDKVTGIDIDVPALNYSKAHYTKSNINFLEMDALSMSFSSESFDAVVCHHTYEHVSDDVKLVDEIYRIMKPGGVCYFGAPNVLMLKESHFDLYFLSWLPIRLANYILKLKGYDEEYYERMRTYWDCLRLLSKFEVINYTHKCVLEPKKYGSMDMLSQFNFLRNLPPVFVKFLTPFASDFVFACIKKG